MDALAEKTKPDLIVLPGDVLSAMASRFSIDNFIRHMESYGVLWAPVNSGFADKCKELGSTKYIFCGHDHENNASITYDGITYTYGLKTGPSPVPWNYAKKTGGTLITITGEKENQSVNIEHIVMNDANV